jgi:DNA-binding LacI/PurR family transcriptional regulator
MSNLQQVAHATGLAVTTVSEILRRKPGYNEATCKRVLAEAKRLGYRPNAVARQLRGGRSGVLGVLIGLDDPQVNLDRLARLEHLAFERGYRLLVGQVREGDQKAALYLEDFAARGVDGLLWLHQPFQKTRRLSADLVNRLGAVVALDEPLTVGGGCVRIDYAAGIQLAVYHLHETGRRRIGLALAGPGQKGDPLQQRRLGYLRAMENLGVVTSPDHVWLGDMVEQPTPLLVGRALEQLVHRGKADALLASNDLWAAAFLRALRKDGLRVPEDVAVVGFDNLAFSALLDPALTTLDQDHEAFARHTLDLMVNALQGGKIPKAKRMVTVIPRLVVRDSA